MIYDLLRCIHTTLSLQSSSCIGQGCLVIRLMKTPSQIPWRHPIVFIHFFFQPGSEIKRTADQLKEFYSLISFCTFNHFSSFIDNSSMHRSRQLLSYWFVTVLHVYVSINILGMWHVWLQTGYYYNPTSIGYYVINYAIPLKTIIEYCYQIDCGYPGTLTKCTHLSSV